MKLDDGDDDDADADDYDYGYGDEDDEEDDDTDDDDAGGYGGGDGDEGDGNGDGTRVRPLRSSCQALPSPSTLIAYHDSLGISLERGRTWGNTRISSAGPGTPTTAAGPPGLACRRWANAIVCAAAAG